MSAGWWLVAILFVSIVSYWAGTVEGEKVADNERGLADEALKNLYRARRRNERLEEGLLKLKGDFEELNGRYMGLHRELSIKHQQRCDEMRWEWEKEKLSLMAERNRLREQLEQVKADNLKKEDK